MYHKTSVSSTTANKSELNADKKAMAFTVFWISSEERGQEINERGRSLVGRTPPPYPTPSEQLRGLEAVYKAFCGVQGQCPAEQNWFYGFTHS